MPTLPTDPDENPPGVLTVCAQGSGQFLTITEALQQAADGAQIRIRPGTYEESLTLDREVELCGEGEPGTVVVTSAIDPCLRILSGNAVIRNLTLQGRSHVRETHDPEDCALLIAGGTPRVQDCDITSTTGVGIAIHGEQTHPTIRSCKIHDGTNVGIWVFEQGKGLIEECVLEGNHKGAWDIQRGCRVHRQGNRPKGYRFLFWQW